MAKIKRYTDDGDLGQLAFICPACKHRHIINDKETKIPNLPSDHIWEFNGDYEKPTIRASILTRWYEYNPITGKHDIERDRCHSYVTDGMINFLSDCHHSLAGQTVELPEIE